jgi:hypothetical protein
MAVAYISSFNLSSPAKISSPNVMETTPSAAVVTFTATSSMPTGKVVSRHSGISSQAEFVVNIRSPNLDPPRTLWLSTSTELKQ